MYSSGAVSMSRSSSQSTDPDSAASVGPYTRSDQPCMLSFKVGDVVWARANGIWSLGVVIDDYDFQGSLDGPQVIPTFTVLTRVGSPYVAPTTVTLSPLFGSLKPADTYMAGLLRAEGVFPLAGTHRTDILDLQMRAHAWLDQRRREAKARTRFR